MQRPTLTQLHDALPREVLHKIVEDYRGLHDEAKGGDVHARKSRYTDLVNHYYDLVTDFYEYGWGQSFHFAPRHRTETFGESLIRQEIYVAMRAGLRPGERALDVGCGVGGPMRNIARFTGAHVVGINNNDYQLRKGGEHNQEARLADRCELVKGDFLKMPFPDASFDAAYAIEATCHAPDKVSVFSQVARVLKPGARFAGYEWCMTSKYDPSNAEHREIKKGIEEGDALPDIASFQDVVDGMEKAGFEVEESFDVAPTADAETPWFSALQWSWSFQGLQGFHRSPVGRVVTHYLVRGLELARVAPKGSSQVSEFLNIGANALVRGGETGIFTPMFFFVGRKR